MSKLQIISTTKYILIGVFFIFPFAGVRNDFAIIGLFTVSLGLRTYELKLQNQLTKRNILFLVFLSIGIITFYFYNKYRIQKNYQTLGFHATSSVPSS